ncbi:hypothetical protein RJT34_19979 [Clitoria ternatea]|uniref:Uncharacterized protein n=1 Tax=Clitoria ternatea TaxID=43366 RepID=A0AAN9IS31_CLITE
MELQRHTRKKTTTELQRHTRHSKKKTTELQRHTRKKKELQRHSVAPGRRGNGETLIKTHGLRPLLRGFCLRYWWVLVLLNSSIYSFVPSHKTREKKKKKKKNEIFTFLKERETEKVEDFGVFST